MNEEKSISRRGLTRWLGYGLGATAAAAVMKPNEAHAATHTGITTVDTISELPPLLPTDQPVYVLGYYDVNDGGGGMFIWVENDTADEDGGHVFESTHASAPAGRWHRVIESPYINAKHFGAKDDMSHDSTPNIQAAIKAAGNLPASEWSSGTIAGGTVVIPKGNYLIGNLYITYPVVLTGVSGDGMGGTTLRVKGGVAPSGSQEDPLDEYSSPWAGKPYNGIILISTDSHLVPGASASGLGATISNLTIRPEATSGPDVMAPTTAAVPDTYFPPDGGNGIYVESSALVTIRKVAIWYMKGNAISVSYAGTHTFHTRVEDCTITGCRGDGIYISGGTDDTLGYYASIQCTDCAGYGFQNRAASSSTFIDCHAERNRLGSFKQVGPAGASVYVGCYWEADINAPDGAAPVMENALIVGGQAARPGRSTGLEERVGFGSARLGFFDEGSFGDYRTQIPAGPHQAALMFRYQPKFPEGATTGPQSTFWGLRRNCLSSEFTLDGSAAEPTFDGWNEGSAVTPYYDRCWVFELDGSNTPAPLGWTDENHPRGAGHLFIGKPVINQRNHWTLRQSVTLAAGTRSVVSIAMHPYWLVPEDGAELGLSFSFDMNGTDLTATNVDLRVGAYSVKVAGSGSNTLQVVVYNDGASSVTADLVVRCEHAKRWSAAFPQFG